MIKRSLILVLALGGLFATQTFADTFVGGVENTNPGGLEGNGDYNDFIFTLSGAGLLLTSNDSGTWSALSGVTLQDSSTSGTPFWNNHSIDDTGTAPIGSGKNVGYCLTTASTTNNCSLTGAVPAVTQYLSVGGSADNNFWFTFVSGQVTSIKLGALESLTTGTLGWYNPFNLSQQGVISTSGTADGTSFSFTPTSTFALYFAYPGTGYYTQNQYDNGGGAGVQSSRFAMFDLPDASVPEPGTMVLFGLGALTLGLLPKLRKRS